MVKPELFWLHIIPEPQVPISLGFNTIHKLLQMIYKCVLNTWNVCFTVTQRTKINWWGHAKYAEEQGRDMAKIRFFEVTAGKQTWFWTQHLEAFVSKYDGVAFKGKRMTQCNTLGCHIRMYRSHSTKVSVVNSWCDLLIHKTSCSFHQVHAVSFLFVYHWTQPVCPRYFHRGTFKWWAMLWICEWWLTSPSFWKSVSFAMNQYTHPLSISAHWLHIKPCHLPYS